MIRLLFFLIIIFFTPGCFGQENSPRFITPEWLIYENGEYVPANDNSPDGNTAYIKVKPSEFGGGHLSIRSGRSFFLFINGKLSGEYRGINNFRMDSLNTAYSGEQLLIAVHQKNINNRELKILIQIPGSTISEIVTQQRPATFVRDFVVFAGLVIIILFLVITQLNPKLASDYFSVAKIFSVREADDAQSSARLTSSNNFQFYISCSLLLSFYILIIAYNLPDQYALPLHFLAGSFWAIMWQWIKLSLIVMAIFLGKIVVVFTLTRLFGMKGLARVHFFNWVRLMMLVIGAATIILFVYYITRGQSETFFVVFLSLIVATLTGWIFLVFLKLNGKTEHSMFHLFSYICATEIIPLLITIKVLFQ